jgi:translation elongation factor EF-G
LDEHLFEKFVNEEEITIPENRVALREAVLQNRVSLSIVEQTLRNKGIQPLLMESSITFPSPWRFLEERN